MIKTATSTFSVVQESELGSDRFPSPPPRKYRLHIPWLLSQSGRLIVDYSPPATPSAAWRTIAGFVLYDSSCLPTFLFLFCYWLLFKGCRNNAAASTSNTYTIKFSRFAASMAKRSISKMNIAIIHPDLGIGNQLYAHFSCRLWKGI